MNNGQRTERNEAPAPRSTYRQAYERGAARLTEAGVSEAKLDARLLLEYVCGTDTQTLLAHGERPVSAAELERYEALLARRCAREPLAYLTGEQEFMGLSFAVTPAVLIPGPDTEILVEEAMRELCGGMRIFDLCTGGGCILLSLLHYGMDCTGVGTDLSPQALAVAAKNGERLGLAERVRWAQGDLWEALEKKEACAPQGGEPQGASGTPQDGEPQGVSLAPRDDASGGAQAGPRNDGGAFLFDMIVSNPPYIPTAVIDTLEPEVRAGEPLLALDGGADGLAFYRRIAAQAARHLRIGGKLFLEIGFDQAQDVTALLREAGFIEIGTVRDYGGRDRVVRAERGMHTAV